DHAATDIVTPLIVGTTGPAAGYTGAFTLPAAPATLVATTTNFTITAANAGDQAKFVTDKGLLQIGTEVVDVTAASPGAGTDVNVTLAHGLKNAHPHTDTVTPQTVVPPGSAQTLTTAGNGGDSILYLGSLGGGFTNTA